MDREHALRGTFDDIVRLSLGGLDATALRMQVLKRLRAVIPVDALFCATVDPATLLFTGAVVEEIPEGATPSFLANEFLQDDVNKFVHLAGAARAVRGLYEITGGDPSQGQRSRDIRAPLGLGDGLRAALRSGATTWGVVCLHRELGASGFTSAEAAF